MYEKNYIICLIAAIVGVLAAWGIGCMFQISDHSFYIAAVIVAGVELAICVATGNKSSKVQSDAP